LKDYPQFPLNKVRTSRYTWWNFLPKNIFEQLMLFSNIYYILSGVLYTIPITSTTSSPLLFWLSVLLVFAITAIKDLVEDTKRKKIDREENSIPVDRYDD
jgi:flagellar biosynthesis component FlhA